MIPAGCAFIVCLESVFVRNLSWILDKVKFWTFYNMFAQYSNMDLFLVFSVYLIYEFENQFDSYKFFELRLLLLLLSDMYFEE